MRDQVPIFTEFTFLVRERSTRLIAIIIIITVNKMITDYDEC